MRSLALLLTLSLASCAQAPMQVDTQSEGVVVLAPIKGKFPEVTKVQLHFYYGPLDIEMKPIGAERWEADLTKAQVESFIRERHGFRVYRAQLKIDSKSKTNQIDTKTQELEINLGL